MAKIFLLQFQFLNQHHTALVSAGKNAGQPYIHIQFIDHLTIYLLSTEHIRYKGFNGYRRLNLFNDPAINKLIERLALQIERNLTGGWCIVRKLSMN
jgi:hypothetical protein